MRIRSPMPHPVWHALALLSCLRPTVVWCQRYADRGSVLADAMPFYEGYEEYATEGYDFSEDSEVYRWNVEEYPNPRDNPRFCNRMKASYVCDPDDVLTRKQADDLDVLIRRLYRETPCICEKCKSEDGGIVLGIALLKNMYQPYNVHPSKIIRSFTEELRATWALGECDNDILIVLATTDRLSYTDVGKSTSSYVSLEEAYHIFLENKGLLATGNFYEGLAAMLENYRESTKTMERHKNPEDDIDVGLISGVIIGVVALIGIAILAVFLFCKYCRLNKNTDKTDASDSEAEGEPSSWKRKDVKVIYSSLKSSDKTEPQSEYVCEMEGYIPETSTNKLSKTPEEIKEVDEEDDEEMIDTRLQVCDDVRHDSEDTGLTEISFISARDTFLKIPDSPESSEADKFLQPKTFTSFESKRAYKGDVTNL